VHLPVSRMSALRSTVTAAASTPASASRRRPSSSSSASHEVDRAGIERAGEPDRVRPHQLGRQRRRQEAHGRLGGAGPAHAAAHARVLGGRG